MSAIAKLLVYYHSSKKSAAVAAVIAAIIVIIMTEWRYELLRMVKGLHNSVATVGHTLLGVLLQRVDVPNNLA